MNRRNGGFTLIELMIVVAIIAILGALAYMSYMRYAVRTHRVAAESCLSEYASYMERYYTTNLRYDQDTAGNKLTAPPALGCASAQQTGANYNYTFAANQPTRSTYVIQATPTGAQLTRDTKCGTLTLDQKGTRTKSGTGTLQECW